MMQDIVEYLLQENIKIEKVILWLRNTTESSELEEIDYIKHEFVSNLLKFLRDETSSFLHRDSHTGLTPIKGTTHVTKYISPNKFSRKPSLRKTSSKAKTLDFSRNVDTLHGCCNGKNITKDLDSSSELEENLKPSLQTPQKENNTLASSLSLDDSPVSGALRSFNTSTPKHNVSPSHWYSETRKYSKRNSLDAPIQPRDLRANERKLVLADYIIIPDKKQSKRKSSGSAVQSCVRDTIVETKCSNDNYFDIEDVEAFPPVGSKISQEKLRTKRINPTPVSNPSSNVKNVAGVKTGFDVPVRCQLPDDAFLLAEEKNPHSIDLERKLLKKEKEKLQKISPHSATSHNSNEKNIMIDAVKCQSKFYKDISLSLVEVTHKASLDLLAQIYASLILYNMVPNVLVELYFLLQILTVDSGVENKNFESSLYLNSVNNCVYFSVKSLAHLVDILLIFDRSFIRTLSESYRIQTFDQLFHKNLLQIYQTTIICQPVIRAPKSPILSVSFQSDTDNKNNFPSTSAFQIFRKQRDLFYEVIRIWENSHLKPGWSFSQALCSKIQFLLSLRADSVNLSHLARLFLSQLLTMCRGDEHSSTSEDTEDLLFLNQLKKQQPEKYKRLHERLITPSKVGGPVPLPSFYGSQEFFRDFVAVSGNFAFNIHLRDALIAKIIQLNSLKFEITELEEGVYSDDMLKEEAWSALQSLRLLAKFLGYLEFLPYKTSECLSDTLIASQIQLRNYVMPSVPLLKILREGAERGCLVMVVSWTVELLSMVDAAAFHTQYYLTLIFELIFLYKILYIFRTDSKDYLCKACSSFSRKKFSVSPINCLYLKLLLGWLFSLPNVPEDLFYATEQEAEIDHQEFQAVAKIIRNSYSYYCDSCLKNIVNYKCKEDRSIINECSTLTPMKENCAANSVGDNQLVSDIRQCIHVTPFKKGNVGDVAVETSPMKTPSKFLEVSMLDTPDNTPDKLDNRKKSDADSTGRFALDSWNFIDHQMLLICCPFVNELKSVLNNFSLGVTQSSGSRTYRKITPFSASDRNMEQPVKGLQLQLEDNFFHNQPSATRKSVDFLVDRIHSNVIRSVRLTIIPMLKDDCLSRLKACVSSTAVTSVSMDKLTEKTEKKITDLSHDLSEEIKSRAVRTMEELLEPSRIKSLLLSLLPLEASNKSVEIAAEIVSRMVGEKLVSWLSVHLTPGFCIKELRVEAKKFIKQSQKIHQNESTVTLSGDTSASCSSLLSVVASNNRSNEDSSFDISSTGNINSMFRHLMEDSQRQLKSFNCNCHNLDATPPSLLLQQIKGDLKALLNKLCKANLNVDVLVRFREIRCTVTERQDMTLAVYRAMEALCVDWMAAMCVCKPKSVGDEAIKMFAELWGPSGIFTETSTLQVFLSPRTIMLLGQNEDSIQDMAWKRVESILTEVIIVHQHLSSQSFQELCVALLQHAWPQGILCGLSLLIVNMVGHMKKSSELKNDGEVVLLTDWVGWLLSEMQFDGDWFDYSF